MKRERVEIVSRNVSKARRDRIIADQGDVCKRANCDEPAIDVDHIIPLWMGGTNRDENLEGLCPAHHQQKTSAEAGIRGKVKRIEKKADPLMRKPSRLQSRGFDKTKRRKFNGKVEERK